MIDLKEFDSEIIDTLIKIGKNNPPFKEFIKKRFDQIKNNIIFASNIEDIYAFQGHAKAYKELLDLFNELPGLKNK